MQSSHLILESHKLLKQRNLLVILSLILLSSNVLLAAVTFFTDKTIILVPNSLDKDSSLTKSKMSQSYIESLSRDVINLMLNVSPNNSEYTSKAILKITHPQFYGELKTALNKRAKDLANRKISTQFFSQTMTLYESKGKGDASIFVSGILSTYLGKEQVLTEDKTYSITYDYSGFQPLVVDFHEVLDWKKDTQGSKQSKEEKLEISRYIAQPSEQSNPESKQEVGHE